MQDTIQPKHRLIWQLISSVILINLMAFMPNNLTAFANETVEENNIPNVSTSSEDLGENLKPACVVRTVYLEQEDCATGTGNVDYSEAENLEITPEEKEEIINDTEQTDSIEVELIKN